MKKKLNPAHLRREAKEWLFALLCVSPLVIMPLALPHDFVRYLAAFTFGMAAGIAVVMVASRYWPIHRGR